MSDICSILLCQLSVQTEFLTILYRLRVVLAVSYSTNRRARDKILRYRLVVRQGRAHEGILAVYFLGRPDPASGLPGEMQQHVQLRRESTSQNISVYWCQARVCSDCISSHPRLSSPHQPSQTCNHDCFLCFSQSFLMYPCKSVQETWFQTPVICLLCSLVYTRLFPKSRENAGEPYCSINAA